MVASLFSQRALLISDSPLVIIFIRYSPLNGCFPRAVLTAGLLRFTSARHFALIRSLWWNCSHLLNWEIHSPVPGTWRKSALCDGIVHIYRNWGIHSMPRNWGRNFKLLRSPGIDSARLCSLACRYDNPISNTQFLSPQRLFKNSSTD
jgi:hypothetical protein